MPDGEDLQRLGVKIERFPALNRAEECANLAAIPQASAQFQFNRQRLVLSIPRAALENRVRGYVPPELWDEGMPAMLLNYGFTGSNSKGRDRFTQSASSYYLNLRPGFNLGARRVRNYTTELQQRRWRAAVGRSLGHRLYLRPAQYHQHEELAHTR